MAYALHETEAIVLSMRARGEADRVLTAYTKEFGGLTLVAKGVRLEKSKLRGAADLFSYATVGFVAGKESYHLTHAETVQVFPMLARDFHRYRAARSLAECLMATVADGERDTRLWALLQNAFTALDNPQLLREHVAAFLYTFQIQMFSLLGYLPEARPRAVEYFFHAPLFSPGAHASTEAERAAVRALLSSLYRYAGREPRIENALV